MDPFIAALFCFRNLTSINLSPPVGFDLDDAKAWDIARAWPHVKFLFLMAATDLRYPSCPRMSLLGLKAFANHCRELVFLSIAFDASTVPSLHGSPENVPQLSLTDLYVDMAPINDPPAVGAFMSALFPNLAEIGIHNDWIWDDPEYIADTDEDETAAAYTQFTRWKTVEAMLPKSKPGPKVLRVHAS
ncbi:hypothetical protein K438DRAFT_1953035 [Mycena galopus ATCC 62051]|nr:hypothetical protein K438DRAFT_1953035 [Mycena galopus ATCC 62051]